MTVADLAPPEQPAKMDPAEILPNQAAIDEIVQHVRQGDYCTILGPRYYQKSFLLQDVKDALEAQDKDRLCILVDLQNIVAQGGSDLLAEFGKKVAGALPKGSEAQLPDDEQSLKTFLQRALHELQGDLVLLVDHLEQIPIGPVTSLLRTLRAVYTERTPEDFQRNIAVVASSLSVADLSLGEQSPFNIAHPILVQDLTEADSDRLIDRLLEVSGARIDETSRAHLKEVTQGDRFLLPKLCRRCIDLLLPPVCLRKRNVDDAVNWFLEFQADSCPPLQETIRVLEDDPTNLLNTLKILDRGHVPARELAIKLDPVINALQLTGAVRPKRGKDGVFYEMRNDLYRSHLLRHFHPERVVHVLRLSGKWEEAITYMESRPADLLQGSLQATFLGCVVDSIYSARSSSQAIKRLASCIGNGFAVTVVKIYAIDFTGSFLELISCSPTQGDEPPPSIPMEDCERREVRTYFGPPYLIDQGILLVRLHKQGNSPFGVAVIEGFQVKPQDDEFLTLLAFLKQAGWALASVRDREREVHQLATLAEIGQRLTHSLALSQVVEKTVEAGLAAVPGAQRGVLVLYDAQEKRLRVAAQHGYRETFADEIFLETTGRSYVARVFQNREGLRIDDAQTDPRVILKHDQDIQKQESVMCVPLVAWGRSIGVFCVDNTTSKNLFTKEDQDLLATFAAQASIAVQNARLTSELYELGMQINRGDMEIEQIFKHAVESIIKVSGAIGANMLLLRDANDPSLSLREKPVLSVSSGLSPDFHKIVKPRVDGLTRKVLEMKEPAAVRSPEDPPGINEAARNEGVQAYLCLPMTVQEKILGVLFVHYDHIHQFSETEKEMLMLFANLCAMAIENARRRDELRISASVAWMGVELSDMGHEITQETSVIRNTISVLQPRVNDDSEALEMIAEIEASNEVIAKIPERSRPPFAGHLQEVKLNEFLLEQAERWCKAHSSVTKNILFTLEDTTVNVDPQRFSIVPKILVKNAVRALEQQVGERMLTISTMSRGDRVIVDFKNTGSRISPKLQRCLFHSPISQQDGAEGAGIGLLIARTVMLGYGGDLELLDSTSTETTFRLWLPLSRHAPTIQNHDREKLDNAKS